MSLGVRGGRELGKGRIPGKGPRMYLAAHQHPDRSRRKTAAVVFAWLWNRVHLQKVIPKKSLRTEMKSSLSTRKRKNRPITMHEIDLTFTDQYKTFRPGATRRCEMDDADVPATDCQGPTAIVGRFAEPVQGENRVDRHPG